MKDDKKFVFNITPINIDELVEQVSSALQKRTELISRSKCPKLWAHIDRLDAKEKSPEAAPKKRRVYRKIFSLMNLLLGIILFVPGCMDPKELSLPFVVGAIGIIAGLIGLFKKQGNQTDQFTKSARLLLQGKENMIADQSHIIFSENEMELRASESERSVIPYSNFEYVIETKDAFLLTYQEYASVLQKKDLDTSSIQEFCDFLCLKTQFVSLCS